MTTESPEPIVSMIEFKGRVLVATTRRIYELTENNTLTEILLVDVSEIMCKACGKHPAAIDGECYDCCH